MTDVDFDAVAVRWLPEGLSRSVSTVNATQFLELRSWEITRSPELWGICVALTWLGALDGQASEAPASGWRGWPSRRQAAVEAAVSGGMADAAPFPEGWWWAAVDPYDSLGLSEAWWAAQGSAVYNRSYHQGVSVALRWAIGHPVEPIAFAPVRYEDFSAVPEEYREAHARLLGEMWLTYL